MKTCILVILLLVCLVSTLYSGTLRPVTPESRSYACMVYDSFNQRAILFGGGNYGLTGGLHYNDVWTFDASLEKWISINASGTYPPPRVMAGAVYNSSGNEMIIFGGWYVGGAHYNDVWSLDLTAGAESWTQLSTTGTPPSARSSATPIIDPINNRMVIFGGEAGGGGFNDVYCLDLNTLVWSQLFPAGTPPSPRFEQSAIYDPLQHQMVIFGGRNGVHYNDVWALDLTSGSETWMELSPGGTLPDPRGRHFCAYDSYDNYMVIGFGFSYPGYFIYYNDAWALELDSLVWHRIVASNNNLPGRRGSCGAWDPLTNQVVIFGGDQYSNGYLGDTYLLIVDTLSVKEDYQNLINTSSSIQILSNPSRLPCKFNVFIPIPGEITINIIDISGRIIKTLVKNRTSSGNYILQWDGNDMQGRKVSAGTYFINLEIDGESVTQKAVIIE